MFGKLKKRYLSEEAVKRALKITSFRNLSKEKIMQFVSMIPYMDKEVAKAIINQFPVFADFGKTVILYYMQMGDNILQKNQESHMAVIQGYQTILNALSERVKAENISEEERIAITEKMILVADKMQEADLQNKKFLDRMRKNAAVVISGILVIGAGLLGLNSSLGEKPMIEDEAEEDDNEDDFA